MGKRSNMARRKHDKYRTPLKPVAALNPHLSPGTRFIEPCAGDGRLVRHLERFGHVCIWASDIAPDDLFMPTRDALTDALPAAPCIITNPPWTRSILHPLIDRFMRHAPTWLLFDMDWCATKQSKPFMRYCSDVVPIGRVIWFSGTTGKDNSAWYRFDIHNDRETRLHEYPD